MLWYSISKTLKSSFEALKNFENILYLIHFEFFAMIDDLMISIRSEDLVDYKHRHSFEMNHFFRKYSNLHIKCFIWIVFLWIILLSKLNSRLWEISKFTFILRNFCPMRGDRFIRLIDRSLYLPLYQYRGHKYIFIYSHHWYLNLHLNWFIRYKITESYRLNKVSYDSLLMSATLIIINSDIFKLKPSWQISTSCKVPYRII